MITFVAGASGATGKHVVSQLLIAGHKVKIIIRNSSNIPDEWSSNVNITILKANISQMHVNEIAKYIADCQAVVSCLGHNITWKGVFGKPKKLVTDTVKLLCVAIKNNDPQKPIRFILMNTAGNSNRDLNEPVSLAEKIVIKLLRLFIPPHPDNEQAADYLRVQIGQNNSFIEWVVVRPDTLINAENVTAYSLHLSPTSSAVFKPGKTSRINVGHFMATLITDIDLWNKWKGQMPVIYNS